jgi:leucyl-tRNA synthetase
MCIVCANEEVLTDGSQKCGNPVGRKNLKQWMLRIPLYAERLLKGLEKLDWPDGVKEMQYNWIGKSTGAEVDFELDGLDKKLRVYTTRPDTLFGATYMVISPEHPIVKQITLPEQAADVEKYVKEASKKSDLDRTILSKENRRFYWTRAVNPRTERKYRYGLPTIPSVMEQVPLWLSLPTIHATLNLP